MLLGLLQGPAELLPISSSAHIALLPRLAGWRYGELDASARKSFEVALHAGAACALAARALRSRAHGSAPEPVVLAVALAPPALAGYLLRSQIERTLGGPRTMAAGLAAGAAAMALADARPAAGGERRCGDARAADGLALGVAQALALVPGVSRSGATLTAARALGFAREDALRLSWQVGLPLMLAAGAHEALQLMRSRGATGRLRGALASGALAAGLSTCASARVLSRPRWRRRSLAPYALYRCALAAILIRGAGRWPQ
jgi:undecaprenyl-diphosphatase